MAWSLRGELIESCSCNVLCPCWLGVQELMVMDQGWCAGPMLFRLAEGQSDGVELGSFTIVIAIDFPGPTLFDGNATARLHIDEAAHTDQRQELEAIFQGKKGGPMEILAGLIANWIPTSYCKIEVEDDGGKFLAKVGVVGEVKSTVLKNEAGDLMTFQNSGFGCAFNLDKTLATIAPSETRWNDPEMPRPFETRSGVRGTWSWQVA